MTNRGGSGDEGRLTKAERREQARLERVEIQARAARRRRNRDIMFGVIIVVAVAVAVFVATRPKSTTKHPTASPTLPGILTSDQPWTNNTTDLGARLAAIGLPQPGGAMHIHSHLDILMNGTKVVVPADIGIDQAQKLESSMHTHATDGVIHMEAATQATFTLGEFFDVWGVRFTSTCLGGSCNDSSQTLQLFVNGKPYTGDPRALALHEHDEVFLAFGTQAQLPKPIPSTFDWANAQL